MNWIMKYLKTIHLDYVPFIVIYIKKRLEVPEHVNDIIVCPDEINLIQTYTLVLFKSDPDII